MVNDEAGCETSLNNPTPTPSTLIEFPGPGRSPRPLWRKELSERVREIQERRLREAALNEHERQLEHQNDVSERHVGGTPLGLVPQQDQPPLNPLVVKALRRIERAQQNPLTTHVRTGARGASAAVARVAKESFEVRSEVDALPSPESLNIPDHLPAPKQSPGEPKRVHALTVVQSKPADEIPLVFGDSSLAGPIFKTTSTNPFVSQDVGTLAPGEIYDDYAPLFHRFVAGLVDLSVVVFAASPFAAIIELTNGDWADERVFVSMGGILLIIMFLYLTTSTSIGGRTWGMSLLSLRAVDVDTGLTPTTKQSVTRAFVFMVSLITFGLGLLYAAVDAEGRGVHDHLSGTTVVRE